MDWDDIVDAKILGPNMKQFGTAVTYLATSGETFPITGVFDRAFFGVDPATGTTVVTYQPTLGVQLSQFKADGVRLLVDVEPLQGDQLVIVRDGTQYVVREVHPDGHGAARLMMNVVEDENG